MDDGWFGQLLSTGGQIVGAARDVGVAQANADAQARIAQSNLAAQQAAFQQNLLLKTSTGLGAGISSNMVLVVMIGAAIFFVINQANR